MITVSELWLRLDEIAPPLPAERVPLAAAAERVLRETVAAPEDQPAFDRSAFDGYLVRADESAELVIVSGSSSPGAPAPALPAPGHAVRILTGGALPNGAAVVMQEDAEPVGDGRLRLLQPPSIKHIRRRGSQARAGDTLLDPGRRLHAGALALLASIGATQPLVARRARVAHLVTGGELVAPEATPGSGQIRDSNSTLIAALLAESGADLCWHRRADDSRSAAAAGFADALATDADILLVSGGASVGDHDHTASLFREHGFDLHCEKVASRPGKPFIAASRDGRLAFGLPGNPLSHYVCFHLFVKRVLDRLAGAEPSRLVQAALAADSMQLIHPNPRETWWPCIWADHGLERSVRPLPWRDSSDLTPLVLANGLLRVPPHLPASHVFDLLVIGG